MTVLDEAGAPEMTDLCQLTLDELAVEDEAVRLVARLTRVGDLGEAGPQAVRVAAFNAYI
ncbi:hypothetical protein [Actinomadura chokoriensis]|uniref:FXSXX-COOH protein n=1 Tax=Actinomadura chokoriensis TaxID=454156 RepID=A0ABV4QPZ8_9ACTN